MVGVGVAPLVVVRSILVILADEEEDSVAAAAAASFSSAAFVFYGMMMMFIYFWGEWGRRRKKNFKKKREKIKKSKNQKHIKIPPKEEERETQINSLSLSLSSGETQKFEREEEEEVFLKARRSVAFDTPQRFRVGSRDDGRIVTHAAETNHKVLRDSFAVSRSDEDEQRIPTSTRIEHEDVGGGDSQDKLGRDANGDEDGRTSVHDERMRESVGCFGWYCKER